MHTLTIPSTSNWRSQGHGALLKDTPQFTETAAVQAGLSVTQPESIPLTIDEQGSVALAQGLLGWTLSMPLQGM